MMTDYQIAETSCPIRDAVFISCTCTRSPHVYILVFFMLHQ